MCMVDIWRADSMGGGRPKRSVHGTVFREHMPRQWLSPIRRSRMRLRRQQQRVRTVCQIRPLPSGHRVLRRTHLAPTAQQDNRPAAVVPVHQQRQWRLRRRQRPYERQFLISFTIFSNVSFGIAPICIVGLPLTGMNRKVGMLCMPNVWASSCSLSMSTL